MRCLVSHPREPRIHHEHVTQDHRCHVALTAACTFQAAVQAQDAEPGKTRAQVIAELDAARASGEQGAYSEDSGSFRLAKLTPEASRSRAEVMGEMFAARASGVTAALTGEDSGSAWLASRAAPPQLAREAVAADVLQARATGELGAMSGEDSGSFWLAAKGVGAAGGIHAGPDIDGTQAALDNVTTAASGR